MPNKAHVIQYLRVPHTLLDSRFRLHGFLQITTKKILNSYVEICTAWLFKYLQIFHYCIIIFMVFLHCFLKIIVKMNNAEKLPPARIATILKT